MNKNIKKNLMEQEIIIEKDIDKLKNLHSYFEVFCQNIEELVIVFDEKKHIHDKGKVMNSLNSYHTKIENIVFNSMNIDEKS